MMQYKRSNPLEKMYLQNLDTKEAVIESHRLGLEISVIINGLMKFYGLDLITAKRVYNESLGISNQHTEEEISGIEGAVKNNIDK